MNKRQKILAQKIVAEKILAQRKALRRNMKVLKRADISEEASGVAATLAKHKLYLEGKRDYANEMTKTSEAASEAASLLGKRRWKDIPKDERAALMPISTGRPPKYSKRCTRYPQHHFSKLTHRCPCGYLQPRKHRKASAATP